MKRKKTGFWSEVRSFTLIILLAVGIRSIVAEPYNIPSSSMVPTLLVGDFILASKYPYGYSRWSFPFGLPLIGHGRKMFHPPKQGDIVLFQAPDVNQPYIKRAIALPGDRVQLLAGRLYLNGQEVPRELLTEEFYQTEDGQQFVYQKYMETLPNGVQHLIYERDDEQPQDNMAPLTVPEGYLFVLGDNRDNSRDSRFFGLVPMENLKGRSEAIWYSNKEGFFWGFFKMTHWGELMRWDRFFTRTK